MRIVALSPYISDNSPGGSVGILVTFMGAAGPGDGLKWSDALLDDLSKLFGPKAA